MFASLFTKKHIFGDGLGTSTHVLFSKNAANSNCTACIQKIASSVVYAFLTDFGFVCTDESSAGGVALNQKAVCLIVWVDPLWKFTG